MAKLTAARAIIYGTLTVAFLDGLYAVIALGMRGVGADRVFQGVAAGMLGPDAFRGGLTTAGIGLALHVFIALVVVLVYDTVSARMAVLRSRPLVWGPVYGVLVYAVMNLIVIPLSAGRAGKYSFAQVLGGLMIHALGVGLPAACFAAARRQAPQPVAPSLQTALAGAGSRSPARVR